MHHMWDLVEKNRNFGLVSCKLIEYVKLLLMSTVEQYNQ